MIGHHNHVPYIGVHDIDALDLARKAFLSTIFFIIKFMENETNLDTSKNLHSFCCGHYNHVLYIGIHDIDSLDMPEKLFFPPFSL